MHRRSFFTLAAARLAGGIAAPSAMAQAYPDRPIEMIVPWGAGGGTDAVGRLIASQLQEELGVPVNVVNRTGGSGVVGHSAIANAAPDGYTIGIMTIKIDMMHWQGLTDLTYADYDILALVNADPGGLMVAADSEYDSAEALLEAIKAGEPGAFKASGTGQGGIWDLGILGWILSEGLPADQITWVPSEGANPGLTDMVAGGVDIVPSSLAEGRALIEAERVKPLATMATEKQGLFPDVPTLSEATGSDWTIAAWRSVVAPKGLPEDVKATLAAAVEKAYYSEAYQNFAKERGFGLLWAGPEEATDLIGKADTSLGDVMKQAGLAKE
jgi:tripartite-type tricarboxylate transporter receptor subunit TctC